MTKDVIPLFPVHGRRQTECQTDGRDLWALADVVTPRVPIPAGQTVARLCAFEFPRRPLASDEPFAPLLQAAGSYCSW
jgi:hypothetical protein